jgi:hypothetical protein
MVESKAQKGVAALAGAVLILLAAIPAQAGRKDTAPAGFAVQRDGRTIMWGSLGATRNSSNTQERIQCSVSRYQQTAVSTLTVVSCSVRNAKGESFACGTTSEAFAEALIGIGNDGNIEIGVDADGNCETVEIDAASDLVRKGA